MNIFGREVGGDKPKKPLQLVQRGTDTCIPIELVAQPSGEVLDLARFERLSVKIFNEIGTECDTPPTDIQDNHLIVEVTADISQVLGTGIYSVEVTGRIPDTSFADGYHDYTIQTPLCRVTTDGSTATPTKVTANVIEGLRGEKGERGEQGVQGERGQDGAKGDQGERGADGAPGKSAYDIALEEGFTGSKQDWLNSLKGGSSQGGFNKVEFAHNLVNFSSSMIELFYRMLYATNDSSRDPEWDDAYDASWLFYNAEDQIKEYVAGYMSNLNSAAKDLGYDYELDDTSIGYRHVIYLLLDMMEIVAKHTYKIQKKEEAALAPSAPTN